MFANEVATPGATVGYDLNDEKKVSGSFFGKLFLSNILIAVLLTACFPRDNEI